MRPRHYREVLGALMRLGCQVMRENDPEVVAVMRGFPVLVYIPRDPELAVDAQRRILEQLGYDVEEYLAAFEALH